MAESARLYLITPRLDAVAPFLATLDAALAAAAVDCVLLRVGPGGRRDLAPAIKLAQRHGAALLIDGDARDAVRAGADGAHMTGLADLAQAVPSLKPDRIIGVGGLASRDECMAAGEQDVDYLMFGEPKPDGYVPPLDATLERTQWWAEIFNVPCVAYAASLDAVRPLAEAGADFVALGDAVWSDARGVATAVAIAAGQLERSDAA